MELLRRTVTTTDDTVDRLRDALLEMATLVSREGIYARPWHDPALPLLTSLSTEKQQAVLRDVEDRIELIKAVKAEGLSPLETSQLMWRSLGRLGWTPQSDVFSYIGSGDVVEIYDLDQRQTFRNLQFFRYVSFTLEEVHSRPWYDLVKRSDDANKAIADAAHRLLSGEWRQTLPMDDMPAHVAEERDSAELLKFMMKFRCLSPVWQDGRLCAIIAVSRVRLI